MGISFLTARQRLARLVGDAAADGTAQFAKWSETEYKDAINFGIDLLRERYLLPAAGEITWVTDTYDYSVPGSLVYIYEVVAEAGTGIGFQTPVAGTGLFEFLVPLDIITTRRNPSTGQQQLHFDKESVKRFSMNQNGLKVRCYGYKYQAELSGDSDQLEINWSVVSLLAKQYLHLAGLGRDPNEIQKHMRQLQRTIEVAARNEDDDIEVPGGIWIDKR